MINAFCKGMGWDGLGYGCMGFGRKLLYCKTDGLVDGEMHGWMDGWYGTDWDMHHGE